jgi:hypothetical protein
MEKREKVMTKTSVIAFYSKISYYLRRKHVKKPPLHHLRRFLMNETLSVGPSLIGAETMAADCGLLDYFDYLM